jgi:hypothetical protein
MINEKPNYVDVPLGSKSKIVHHKKVHRRQQQTKPMSIAKFAQPARFRKEPIFFTFQIQQFVTPKA